jgi:hypothetical protein
MNIPLQQSSSPLLRSSSPLLRSSSPLLRSSSVLNKRDYSEGPSAPLIVPNEPGGISLLTRAQTQEIREIIDYMGQDNNICPSLRLADPSKAAQFMNLNLKEPGSTLRIQAEQPYGRHLYGFYQRLVDCSELAALVRMEPMLFALLWAGALPGGAEFSFPPQLSQQLRLARLKNTSAVTYPLMDIPADLTRSRDPIIIRGYQTTWLSDDQMIISFCALTRYGHAMEGSVLHTFYVDGDRMIIGMTGAGGNSATSYFLNNMLAIDSGFGIWTGLANNMTLFAEGVNSGQFRLETDDLLNFHKVIQIYIENNASLMNGAIQDIVRFGSISRVLSRWRGDPDRIIGDPDRFI